MSIQDTETVMQALASRAGWTDCKIERLLGKPQPIERDGLKRRGIATVKEWAGDAFINKELLTLMGEAYASGYSDARRDQGPD